ncbi:hypothetical protein MTO96_015878 [Rhipicephalus appendiculatus]
MDVSGNSPQKPVFGFPLEEHLRVNGRRIALVVEKCAACLLASGMDEEGLFRITGSASKIKKLKSAFNAGFADMSEFERDPHTVASVLKLYLRELPEPLMTFDLYDEWMKAASVSDASARLQALWQVVNNMPQANQDNLRYVVKFLARLVGHREQNKMSSQNIAIVIAPQPGLAQGREPVTAHGCQHGHSQHAQLHSGHPGQLCRLVFPRRRRLLSLRNEDDCAGRSLGSPGHHQR